MAELRRVRIDVAHEHPTFAGHFPGQPLLPGVVLLSHVLEVLLSDGRLGLQSKLSTVKFLAPVRPGADLEVRWNDAAAGERIRFEVWRLGPDDGAQGVLAASGQLEAGSV